MTEPIVRDLRRRWKPHKEQLLAAGGEQATSIRFHRACSWMARVEQMPEEQDHDLGLVSLWIAFNSLYGQWDAGKRSPPPHRTPFRSHLDLVHHGHAAPVDPAPALATAPVDVMLARAGVGLLNRLAGRIGT